LCIDILIGLWASYREESKPKPLTFLELFNFLYDVKEEIIKHQEEEKEEIKRQMFEQILKLMDEIHKLNEK